MDVDRVMGGNQHFESSLLQALREEGFGTIFKGALSTHWVIFVAYTFIGNIDLVKTAKYFRYEFEDVGTQMQWALNL